MLTTRFQLPLSTVNLRESLELFKSFLWTYWYLVLLLLGAARVVYQKWFSPLSMFPGPFWAHVTNWYSVWVFFTYKMEEIEWKLHKKYGDVVRYMPNFLLISDPKLLSIVYHRSADKDPNFYTSGGFGLGVNVLTSTHHETHRRLRKRIAPSFTMTSAHAMEYLIDELILKFQSKMDQLADSGETFDFASWSHFFTYDVISELAFGKAFGFMEHEKDLHNLLHGLKVGLPLIGLISRVPVLNKILGSKVFAPLMMPKAADKDGFGAMMRYRDYLLTKRFDAEAFAKGWPLEDKDGQKDILHHIASSRDDDGTPITIEEVKNELLVIMVAGSDTTSNILRQFIYRVLLHSGYYQRLVAELDDAYVAGKLSIPIAKYVEVTSLSLFNAILKETLRLDPSTPSVLPRVAPKGGYYLNGLFVPEGTVVSANPWVVNRHPGVYGADAEQWRPERWLEPEQAQEFEKYQMTFGYGTRVCLGKNVALVELSKLLCQLFLHYRPQLVDLEKHGSKTNIGAVFQRNMLIKMYKRKLSPRHCVDPS